MHARTPVLLAAAALALSGVGCRGATSSTAGALGEPCATTADCVGSLTCDPTAPGGACTRGCAADGDCGAGNRCVSMRCFPGCATSTDCSRGTPYACVQVAGTSICAAVIAGDGGAPDEAGPRDLLPPPAADLATPPPDLATPPPDLGPGCGDGVRDGKETDVDCGGPDCAPCGGSRYCNVAADCLSAACVGFHCTAPASCGDGVQDGKETDVDCGGLECTRCYPDGACRVGDDCRSLACASGRCTGPAHCSNQTKDSDESDVDCGGNDCARCANRATCFVPRDCASGSCRTMVCVDPTCGDGRIDGSETAVDCGGPGCVACANGAACLVARDCLYGNCTGGVCTGCGDWPACRPGDRCDLTVPAHFNPCVCDASACQTCCDNNNHCQDFQASSSCGTGGVTCKLCSFNGVNGCFPALNMCQSECGGCWQITSGGGIGVYDGTCVGGNQDTACGLPFGMMMPNGIRSMGLCVACPAGQHCVSGTCK